MSISNKIVKAGIGYTVGNILVKGAVFLTLPIFTRLMTPDNFGMYSIFLTYANIIFIFTGCCLQNTIKNAFYDFKEKIDDYVESLIIFNVFVTAILLTIILLFDILSNKIFYILLALQAFSISMFSIFNVYLSIFYEYKTYIKVSCFNTMVSILLSILFLLNDFFENRYMGRVWGTVIPYLISSGYIFYYFYNRSNKIYEHRYIKYGLSFSTPLIIHGLSTIILGQIDTIVIQRYCGNIETGLFTFALIYNTIFVIITSSVINAWGPWLFSALNEERFFDAKQKSKLFFEMILFFSLILMLLIPEITMILADKAYEGSIQMSMPLVMSGYMMFLYQSFVNVEYYYKKTSYIAVGSILSAIFNFILAYLLIPTYGVWTAPFIHLGSYVVYAGFHLYYAKKLADVFDVNNIVWCSVTCLLIMSMAIFFKDNIFIRFFILLIIVERYYNLGIFKAAYLMSKKV